MYISRYPEYDEEITEIVDQLIESDVIHECFELDGEPALRIIEDAILDAVTPTISELGYLRNLDGTQTYAYNPSNGHFYPPYNVPVLRQMTSYFCGPAATAQALVGNGALAEANYSTTRQYIIADELGTTIENGTEIGRIRDYLNQVMGYNSSSNRYAVKAFTQFSYDKALYYIRNSLYYDACPIFRIADTSYFDYYNGTEQTHYVTISQYNASASNVRFVDPNYDVTYRGYHDITFDDLETAIYTMSRYEILDSFFVVRTTDYNTDAYTYIY
ncbi:MAG: C39 family peptidase [Ruminiclostridium sp.]|nr:C39 family peptidase [Ruminiclostridium sp.]